MILWCTYDLFLSRTDYVCPLVLKYEPQLQVVLAAVIAPIVLLYNASRRK